MQEQQQQQQECARVLPPARLPPGLQCRPSGVQAIAVSFDDKPQQQRGDQWQQQAGSSRQGTFSELWESGGGPAGDGADPWDDIDHARAQNAPTEQQQQPLQPQVARRVPTFAARRRPLAFSQPEHREGAGCPAGQGEADEEDWDQDLLQQVEALEQQALQGQRPQQPPPGGRPSLSAPVFRNRAFFQQQPLPGGAWPAGAAAAGSASADGIEESDSDHNVEADAGMDARPASHGAARQRAGRGAVPQLGRRTGAAQLSLSATAAASEGPPTGAGTTASAAAGRPPTLAARRQAAAAAADVQLLQIDFATVDFEALRPSVLLGWVTARKGRSRLAACCACTHACLQQSTHACTDPAVHNLWPPPACWHPTPTSTHPPPSHTQAHYRRQAAVEASLRPRGAAAATPAGRPAHPPAAAAGGGSAEATAATAAAGCGCGC